VHADQIEWFCRNLKEREKAIISLHTHNDRGTGVAATELALMAGAERVEGTLFGNGERTGNLDVVTVALNMYSLGVDPKLDFHDLPRIREIFERCTRMEVPPRHPYAGDLVFTAFSGSHQDAIKKGMDRRRKAAETEEDSPWEVPYLLVDPQDIGRTYEAIIRINSQSGKGGVAYVMSRDYGYELPKKMHPDVGAMVNRLADREGRELTGDEVFEAFRQEFIERENPLKLLSFRLDRSGKDDREVKCTAKVSYQGREATIQGKGNGPIDSFVHAMASKGWKDFQLLDFHEHSVGKGSETEAVAYIQIETRDGVKHWGAGTHTSINLAGLKALISAYNRSRR
jgi:2-isopropylmalate synthase